MGFGVGRGRVGGGMRISFGGIWSGVGFPEAFRGGRMPTKSVGGCVGGGSPPHEFSRPGSQGRAL